MMLKRRFSYIFGSRLAMCEALAVLCDREAQHNISSLFEDDDQCSPIDTGDVTLVTIKHLRAHYWAIHVHVKFGLDGEPSYSPYNFDGEYDLPKLQTFRPKPDNLTGFEVDPEGAPYEWGEEV